MTSKKINLVFLTNGKDLLFAGAGNIACSGKKQVLRCAQDDKVVVVTRL